MANSIIGIILITLSVVGVVMSSIIMHKGGDINVANNCLLWAIVCYVYAKR
jgi:hypothetical protein